MHPSEIMIIFGYTEERKLRVNIRLCFKRAETLSTYNSRLPAFQSTFSQKFEVDHRWRMFVVAESQSIWVTTVRKAF